ncbi:hypothetical protein O181_015486 [Austropuccinia psidii MF-1]|uniref:Small-subunit processome Utp12 domain-containing protein n=1 Tax=Austropuccinia psidii MF-1 TaxID=1389203 RepID=A0A9Q3C012_9BASI|nr:hypothetical protein [Austropuccinia psidii MF-1]
MVKSYFLHGGTEVFGLIASNTSNSLFDGKRAYVPALEDVYVWDLKRGEHLGMWHATSHTSPVTYISRSPTDPDKFAVGYQDGSIRVWSAQSKEVITLFEGHRRGISNLAWDRDGVRLVSGALDGEIVLWDVTGETGLFKLRGHNHRITGLVFVSASPPISDPSSSTALPPSSTHLLSTSQDTYLKLWDLQTQHSIESLIAHRSECWSLAVLPQLTNPDQDHTNTEVPERQVLLLTTGGEGEAKLWTLSETILINGPQRSASGQGFMKAIFHVGNLTLATSGAHGARVLSATSHAYSLRGGVNGIAIAFQVGDRAVEVWRVQSPEEVKTKSSRRKKKEAAKRKDVAQEVDKSKEAEPAFNWAERFSHWVTLRGSGKVVSFAFPPTSNRALISSQARPAELQILLALASNSLEVFTIPRPSSKSTPQEPTRLHKVALPGHRTNIRTVFLSSNDQLVATGSNGALKVWNVKTQKCIRTFDCGYVLCGAWLPGDRHILVGTKAGQLMLYELSSSTLLESYNAHTQSIWSLDIRPDGKAFVTGSADKSVKFWNFAPKAVASQEQDSVNGDVTQKCLSLSFVHFKTIKMTNDVMGVRYSPDLRFIAVSTLDCTVKIFFQDTLKFFLSLYGHKLPILDLDISFDSKLLVTCSADKNVKLWGLDFGDCHKSIFAHEESVMQVAFESNSHYFWTAGKDGLVKYWDGDKFENIQILRGHHKEVSSLAVSHNGIFLITGSFDQSIRIWEKTDEPLFLEEEREKELERLYNQEETQQAELLAVRKQKLKENGKNNEVEEAGPVSKPTAETLMSGEKIVEALILAASDLESIEKYRSLKSSMQNGTEVAKLAPPVRNPIFVVFNNISAHAYVLKVVQNVPRAALEDALLVLPFAQVIMLLTHIKYWIEQGWMTSLTCRVLFFLLRVHETQITATESLKLVIHAIKTGMGDRLTKQRDTIGYNVEAVKFLKRQIEDEQQDKQFFDLDVKPLEEVKAMTGKAKKRKLVL